MPVVINKTTDDLRVTYLKTVIPAGGQVTVKDSVLAALCAQNPNLEAKNDDGTELLAPAEDWASKHIVLDPRYSPAVSSSRPSDTRDDPGTTTQGDDK